MNSGIPPAPANLSLQHRQSRVDSALGRDFAYFPGLVVFQSLHTMVTAPEFDVPGLAIVSSSIKSKRTDARAHEELMLWAELSSVAAIIVLSIIVLTQHGWAIDASQFSLRNTSFEGFRLAFVFSLLSFVGFETATSLGCEAKRPLSSVPKALLFSTVLSGLFFVATTYAVVYGFKGSSGHLEKCSAPLISLSNIVHCPWLGTATVIGAMVSFFASCIACLNTASRLILTMSHDGYFPASFKAIHLKNQTPHRGIFAAAIIGGCIALALLFSRFAMLDIVAWTGSIACYGFVLPYAMLSACAPFVLRREGILRFKDILLSVLATLALSSALIGAFYPLPAAPFLWFPYGFLVYLGLGAALYVVRRKSNTV